MLCCLSGANQLVFFPLLVSLQAYFTLNLLFFVFSVNQWQEIDFSLAASSKSSGSSTHLSSKSGLKTHHLVRKDRHTSEMTRTACTRDLIRTVHSFNPQSGTRAGSLTQQKLYYILGGISKYMCIYSIADLYCCKFSYSVQYNL